VGTCCVRTPFSVFGSSARRPKYARIPIAVAKKADCGEKYGAAYVARFTFEEKSD